MTEFPKRTTGTSGLAGTLNRLQALIMERTPIDGPAMRFERTARGFRPVFRRTVAGTDGAVVDTTAKMFKVLSVHGDFVRCHEVRFNTTTGLHEAVNSTDVIVAKPWTLRQSPFDATTRDGVDYNYDTAIQRRLTRGIYVETQVITPAYTVAGAGLTGSANTAFDIIFARDISGLENRDYIRGYTADAAYITPGAWTAADWIDENRDARAWAAKSLLVS